MFFNPETGRWSATSTDQSQELYARLSRRTRRASSPETQRESKRQKTDQVDNETASAPSASTPALGHVHSLHGNPGSHAEHVTPPQATSPASATTSEITVVAVNMDGNRPLLEGTMASQVASREIVLAPEVSMVGRVQEHIVPPQRVSLMESSAPEVSMVVNSVVQPQAVVSTVPMSIPEISMVMVDSDSGPHLPQISSSASVPAPEVSMDCHSPLGSTVVPQEACREVVFTPEVSMVDHVQEHIVTPQRVFLTESLAPEVSMATVDASSSPVPLLATASTVPAISSTRASSMERSIAETASTQVDLNATIPGPGVGHPPPIDTSALASMDVVDMNADPSRPASGCACSAALTLETSSTTSGHALFPRVAIPSGAPDGQVSAPPVMIVVFGGREQTQEGIWVVCFMALMMAFMLSLFAMLALGAMFFGRN
ncbi:hypothetical protein EIP91_008244 [Steccherinum ochraceum]|uniref:Uncharacterized protein n=1 Tax=Steccherinum ochraceum TaxID=92696 RepID=A0A4R0R345_9APHY|nr:hypothetical protein EIP91_008244 [Steccherinum ochraceum]